MRPKHALFLLLTLLLVLTACEHKELCYHHMHDFYTRIYVNWAGQPERPSGMTVTAYPVDGSKPVERLTNNISYADLLLDDGTYNVLVYNQSHSEFSTIGFSGMDRFETAQVFAIDRKSAWYTRGPAERVVHSVEWVASGAMDDLVVDKELQQKQAHVRGSNDYFADRGTVRPQTRVVDIKVTVYVKGIQYLRSMRGSLNGMSGGRYLATGAPITEKVTHLLEQWEVKAYDDNPTEGELVCHFGGFGLPADHQDVIGENQLKLSILLADNKTVKNFEFQVGDRFEVNTELELALDLKVGTGRDDGPIEIPSVEVEGSGGFDVKVGDWGAAENIEL